MKKAMMLSGTFSAAAFTGASFSKIMESHLTDFLLFLGFMSFVFLFLPLVFLIKIRETQDSRDKWIFVSGSIAGLLYFVCMLLKFLLPAWPGFLGPRWSHPEIVWQTLWLTAFAIAVLVFLPLYFLTGIHKPATKTNTIVLSLLLVGFIAMQFSFTNLGPFRPDKHPLSRQVVPSPADRSGRLQQALPQENKFLAKSKN